jgi:hypothetical protein
MKRIGWVLIGCVALGACASTPKQPAIVWIGGPLARLEADKAECRKDADGVDVHQASGYSDPRYGMTSAMADAIGRDNPLMDQRAAIREAAFQACMNDNGWKIQ